jgi:low affinity Fe/Cu permease
MKDLFHKFSHRTSEIVGAPWAFCVAVLTIIIWALTGPMFHYSDTWQLVINTGTTVVTFLIVFLIQNTQNRDAKAIHLKLDELIRCISTARNSLIDLEDLEEAELMQLQTEFVKLRESSLAIHQEKIDKIEQKIQRRKFQREETE